MIGETEMKTLICSQKVLAQMITWKEEDNHVGPQDDNDQNLSKLVNLITFEKQNINASLIEKAESAGLKVYNMEQILQLGEAKMENFTP